MMDTVLNIGLTDVSVEGLAKQTSNPRFAWDAYRRLIQGFGAVVLDIEDEAFEDALDALKQRAGVKEDVDLTQEQLSSWSVNTSHRQEDHRQGLSPEPIEQLRLANEAVFRS